jgi:prostaglandin-endoperoxide synthase 2
VARLIIPSQGFDTAGRAFGENLSFSPWHGLDAHRPLGGINRVRRTVYQTISRVRHEINGVPGAEPKQPTPLIAPTPIEHQPKELSMGDSIFDGLMQEIGQRIDDSGWADKFASNLAINRLVNSAPNRPHPFSTASDYTSWKSLTDKTYQGRQLPPDPPADPPPIEKVMQLFHRTGTQKLSPKSTCLFPAFAQYLTDGFIRTGIPGQAETPLTRTRTSSNHEIDLCPLYGRTEQQTNILRLNDNTAGRRGRLKSQMIGNEEYSPYLFIDGKVDPAFAGLDPPLWGPTNLPPTDPAILASLFAVGGDRVNTTPFSAMMNTLLLREHNRVAGEIERNNPGWDDEHVFEVARNIMIAMFIKIVVEQYINHITPLPFNLVADPSVAWTANWNRPNWMTAEFSLLYRWHSLMPDTIEWPGAPIPLSEFSLDNRPLLKVGLASAFKTAAAQPTGELGALNTSEVLRPVESLAIKQARTNRLPGYNAYRKEYGFAPATTFEDISSDPAVLDILKALYASPDDVEFYPGLFAEDRVPRSPLPGLLITMVGVDAFSQALTNPLLSQHVYNEDTFTPWGFALITETSSLGQILQRQGADVDPKTLTMTQLSWNYWDVS